MQLRIKKSTYLLANTMKNRFAEFVIKKWEWNTLNSIVNYANKYQILNKS